ncbi:hypothetical protein KCP78_18615 [Salmonella enterica subsp. enterica]|nr:hypothetical protein KCP78_18615 [Salmonella enterica subsp. enterica]
MRGSIQELIDLNFAENEIAAVVAEGELEWRTSARLARRATPAVSAI